MTASQKERAVKSRIACMKNTMCLDGRHAKEPDQETHALLDGVVVVDVDQGMTGSTMCHRYAQSTRLDVQ